MLQICDEPAVQMIHKPVLVGMTDLMCSDEKIWEMLNERTNVSETKYREVFDRRNLIRGNISWDSGLAQNEATRLFFEFFKTGRVIVLLGEDVRRSFRMKKNLMHPVVSGGCTWRQVPYPSKHNTWYDRQENKNLVAILLEDLYNAYTSGIRR